MPIINNRARPFASSLMLAALLSSAARPAPAQVVKPLPGLREQAEIQQGWLKLRLERVLPKLMRKHGVQMWLVICREYNEDPVFFSLVSPTVFAARRRTIYVFYDPCGKIPRALCDAAWGRVALGGSSQGGVYRAMRSARQAAGPAGGRLEQRAELLGEEQWQVLKQLVEERDPRVIAINTSRDWAFADGLTAAESEGMRKALGEKWTERMRPSEQLAVELIATRLPEEEPVFERMNALAWGIIDTAFSSAVITAGRTSTEDVVWWMRQKLNDLGLDTWFQPSVSVQRRGATAEQLGDNPIIQRGDVLHCDFGVTAMRLNTDTQHMGYVLREGESEAPAGLRRALANSNRLQDIVVAELRPGRSGNEVLRASLERMRREGIDGTVYSHPVGMHGHGAGPLIGLWDRQEGVPGRGDAHVLPSTWFSIELQATTPVAEWGGQPVRSAQEEDVIIGADGRVRWAYRRQTEFHVVR
jgi:Xaa-Pro aminopeptidase